MAQTVGTRAGNAHRSDYLVTCAYCGAVWYRSACRRNAAGQLVCPDDQHIRDPVTLSRLNAARTSRLRRPKVDGGNADREAVTTAGPLTVTPSLIVTGWDAAVAGVPSSITLDGNGRVSNWVAAYGGLTLVNDDLQTRPKLKTDGPSGRSYVSFEGVHFLVESTTVFVRPAPRVEPTFYWAVLRRPRWTQSGVWWGFESVGGASLALFNSALHPPPISGQYNGTGTNSNAFEMGFFKRVTCVFTDSASDTLTIGSNVSAEGISAGNNEPSDDFVIGTNGFAAASYLDLCELWILKAAPSAAELAQLDDYARAKYGSAVLL